MPEFIDFLLTFGISENPRDFHYSGFRSPLDSDDISNRLALGSLDRSGRELRLCHILRSVERLHGSRASTSSWPWMLRPTVTYHSFDLETNRSVWLIVKANHIAKVHVRDIYKEQDLYRTKPNGGINNTFESTLRTHFVLCAPVGEDSGWYIDYIEERVQSLTQRALTESSDGDGGVERNARRSCFI
jgi:hypothetical protein